MHHSNRLRELREAAGLKPYDVAAKLRVNQSTVSRWERGGTIPDDHKQALADLFDVTRSYLMRWDEDEQPRRKKTAAA